jgi:hypothetical protein
MRIDNALEALAASIHMKTYDIKKLIQEGRYEDAVKVFRDIEMSCYVAHQEISAYNEWVFDQQDKRWAENGVPMLPTIKKD